MANTKDFKVKNGIQATRYSGTAVAMAADDVDLSAGTYFTKTISGATTITFSNPPASGKAVHFTLVFTGDGSAITWPTSVKWEGGAAPATPASSAKDMFTLLTVDGGTTYYGKKAGAAFS